MHPPKPLQGGRAGENEGSDVAKKKRHAVKKSAAKKKKKKFIPTDDLKNALTGLGDVVKRGLDEGDDFKSEDHVDDMRRAAEGLQAAVEGFKRELKRRMLEDGIFETKKSKRVHAELKLKPGKNPGSKDPDDYDSISQRFQ